jgi:hypothetical protein
MVLESACLVQHFVLQKEIEHRDVVSATVEKETMVRTELLTMLKMEVEQNQRRDHHVQAEQTSISWLSSLWNGRALLKRGEFVFATAL